MHRDLKSANVFLYKDGTAKLGDLNVSKIVKSGLGYTQTGTPYYASPEVWKDKPYDIKSDIWSLGWVLYEMITLKPPFRAEDMQSLFKVVLKGVYPKISNKYSVDLQWVVKELIQVNPKKRPTCRNILDFESIISRDKTRAHFEDERNDILLQTIYVPKNLMFLTDILPKPKYDISDSNYYGSEVDSLPKPIKKRTLDRIKYSPIKRINDGPDELSLPSINKNNESLNIVEQIKKRYKINYMKQNQKLRRQRENDVPRDQSIRVKRLENSELNNANKDLSNYKSESRAHSLEQPTLKSNHGSKKLLKNSSYESLLSRDKNAQNKKLSSAERIASKLSMNNDKGTA
jgi:NIMA (never in mitosis gene a)-related kinase 1/4/5